MKHMISKQESVDEFETLSKEVRDAAEELYDIFDRRTLKNILKQKESPSMFRSITARLSSEDTEKAVELALDWAGEDSSSSSRFPESSSKRRAVRERYNLSDYEIEWWAERDRLSIVVTDQATNRDVWEAWDKTVQELIEDGYIDWGNNDSVMKYLVDMDIV